MSTPTLYGFIIDAALRQSSSLDLTGSIDQGYGMLIGEPSNYFATKGRIGDSRRNRLLILDNQAAFGDIEVQFDQNQFDIKILKAMTDVDNALLMNIVERIYLQQAYSDSNLEHQLTTASTYRGYTAESMSHGPEVGTVKITNNQKTQTAISIRDWISFDFETENVKFKVHLWVSSKAFAKDYPFTTITRVLPPYEPKVLVDPATLVQAGNLSVLTASSSYIFDKTNLETVSRDQNGIYSYSTKYVIDVSKTLWLPFALAYCGAKTPSTLECRKAIRQYLEANTSLTQDKLRVLFPELYIAARFFVVPLWDVKNSLTDRDVYNSVFSMSTILQKSKLAFSTTAAEFFDKNMELLLNAQNKMLCVCMPDELNDRIFSILKQHPTYQDYSSNVSGWKYMTAKTQEFAGKLNRCMAILNGEAVSSEFVTNVIGGKSWLSFTSGKAEYLVLTRDSYNTAIANL